MSGRGLLNVADALRDVFALRRFSDPYVKLRLGGQKKKTKVVKKNLSPVWDEEFTLYRYPTPLSIVAPLLANQSINHSHAHAQYHSKVPAKGGDTNLQVAVWVRTPSFRFAP